MKENTSHAQHHRPIKKLGRVSKTITPSLPNKKNTAAHTGLVQPQSVAKTEPLANLAPQSWPIGKPLPVDLVTEEGLFLIMQADVQLCRELATQNELVAVESLTLQCLVTKGKGGRYHVTGTLNADVMQVCVVSLEPFAAHVHEEVALCFAPVTAINHSAEAIHHEGVDDKGAGASNRTAPSQGLDLGREEPPDPLVDGKIDFAKVAAEFLTLGLDLYPRKPGVEFAPVVFDGALQKLEAELPAKPLDKPSPFAVLATLKQDFPKK